MKTINDHKFPLNKYFNTFHMNTAHISFFHFFLSGHVMTLAFVVVVVVVLSGG